MLNEARCYFVILIPNRRVITVIIAILVSRIFLVSKRGLFELLITRAGVFVPCAVLKFVAAAVKPSHHLTLEVEDRLQSVSSFCL